MRSLFAAVAAVSWSLVGAPLAPGENVVLGFQGAQSQTTALFKVADKWEVRWDAPQTVHLTVLAPDGTILAGASCAGQGSLFQPKGGSFYLQITAGSSGPSWHLSVVEIDSAAPENRADAPPGPNYTPPTVIPSPGATNAVALAAPPAPPTANTPPQAPASTVAGQLTDDQSHAVVVIKGDVAEGTGFLVKTPDGPAVVTNIHVIFANPHIKIFTTNGAEITTVSLKGASDRDLAVFTIKDDHYSYLELNNDIANTVQTGDALITPGNSEGGEVVLNTKGKVVGIGPQQIEFSNPIYHGNSGGPVFHLKSGRVIAVVTQATRVRTNDDLDKASYADKNSAITGPMRYFGYRLDTVPKWEPYDWNRFLNESTFLTHFHFESRCLDSYLNGTLYERAGQAQSDPHNGPPNSKFYLQDDRVSRAQDNFHHLYADADESQRMDARREMVMDLQSIADTDMTAIQNPDNFYSFDQIRAKQEIAYRSALKKELDTYGDKISAEGH